MGAILEGGGRARRGHTPLRRSRGVGGRSASSAWLLRKAPRRIGRPPGRHAGLPTAGPDGAGRDNGARDNAGRRRARRQPERGRASTAPEAPRHCLASAAGPALPPSRGEASQVPPPPPPFPPQRILAALRQATHAAESPRAHRPRRRGQERRPSLTSDAACEEIQRHGALPSRSLCRASCPGSPPAAAETAAAAPSRARALLEAAGVQLATCPSGRLLLSPPGRRAPARRASERATRAGPSGAPLPAPRALASFLFLTRRASAGGEARGGGGLMGLRQPPMGDAWPANTLPEQPSARAADWPPSWGGCWGRAGSG